MLSKWKLKYLSVAVLSVATIHGCGKKESQSYDMSTQAIFANGCLNLGNLYASLHSMPNDAVIRAVTYDFTTADKDESGYSPSSSRLRIANRAAYSFSQGRPSDLQNTWTSATQDECASGALFDAYGNSTPFTVEEYEDTWIKVKLPDESTQKFDLTSERSLKIYIEGFTGSQCITHAPLRSTTEMTLRWGPASDLSPGEAVSGRYMRELSQSVAQAPAALRASVSEMTTNEIRLATTVLSDMNNMTVRPQDQRMSECPSGSKAPTMPQLPTPTPTPIPEATPEPVATPSETPEATPSPEVEPSPTPEI